MWRTAIEITLLIAIGFISGLFVQSRIHQCPEPKSYSSYKIEVSVPKTPEETKRLMLLNRAQHSILQQLEDWDREKEKKEIKRGK